MNVRVALPDDAQVLSDLVISLSRFLLDGGVQALPEWFLKIISADALRTRLDSREFYTLVCEADGRIAGFICVKNRTQIYHLFVSEHYHHRGIAKLLWSHVLTRFGSAKYFVRSSIYAVPVYKTFGFHQAGEVQSRDGISFQPMELARS